MGRKDGLSKGPALESYRKRIGKQDYQKSKASIKEMKHVAEAKKSSTALQDIILTVVAFAIILAMVYVMFYFTLDSEVAGDGT